MLGSMLSIKPIIDIADGEVEEAAKQRTRRKSLEWLRDTLFAGARRASTSPCSTASRPTSTSSST